MATVQEAEREANLAKELLDTLEGRVREGDPDVTPAQLAESRELARFAELRIEAAQQRAAAARKDAFDERGRALREQAERMAGAGDAELAALFADAVAALARLVRVAGERRDVVREFGRAVAALASDAGTDWRAARERWGVQADHDTVIVSGEVPVRVRSVTPVDVASAVVEIALDRYDRNEVLAVQRTGAVVERLPAVVDKLSMSPREVTAVRTLIDPGRDVALASMRERAADVSR